MHESDNPIWRPSEQLIAQANVTRFMDNLALTQPKPQSLVSGRDLKSYADLHQWSVEQPELFWQHVWQFCGMVGSQGNSVLKQGNSRWQQPRPHRDAIWFPDAQVNYAENLLYCAKTLPNKLAIWFENEHGDQQTYTWQTLSEEVSSVQQWLIDCGVQQGDVVAAYTPYLPQTVVAMLATTSLGAIWTSTSPDFGVESVIERFGQVKPKVLFTCDGYTFNDKTFDMTDKNHDVLEHLNELKQVCLISYLKQTDYLKPNKHLNQNGKFQKNHVELGVSTQSWQTILSHYQPQSLCYTRVNFNNPLFVLYSSGTTGKPKCIVHSVGGTIINHLKEHQLHCDIKPNDRVFYYTTCGWMMWNWHVSALASGACLVIFDGSPVYPQPNVLWDLAQRANVSLFGTSAKYLEAIEKAALYPAKSHSLPQLRTLCSTGSVLYPKQFDYVYKHIKQDLHLASISGGTDICGCFVLGNPISPVYRGECQFAGLGIDVRVFDSEGQSLTQQRGELVCSNSLPNFPTGFWNDTGERYHSTYWDKFDNVWHHGDEVEQSMYGGYLFYGRGDTTLNPGGVRIGTAEIYQQVNTIEGILDSIAVGKDIDRNEQIWLFVQLQQGITLSDELLATIKSKLKSSCSPRHVPSQIFAISDIPKTRSGKLVELAVKQVVNGKPVENIGAIANADVLNEIKRVASL